jgi:hypothetical protein
MVMDSGLAFWWCWSGKEAFRDQVGNLPALVKPEAQAACVFQIGGHGNHPPNQLTQ